jgi:hypothetical protein
MVIWVVPRYFIYIININ